MPVIAAPVVTVVVALLFGATWLAEYASGGRRPTRIDEAGD